MKTVGRSRKSSSFITGENHDYQGIARTIRKFEPLQLKKNESFLREKVLSNQGFIKSLFQKGDFSCLSSILNTNLATFKERMQHHGQLQTQFTTAYRENARKEYQVAELRRQMQELQNENERLKSRVILAHEEKIKAYEESLKQEQKRVIVIEQANSGKIVFQDSGRVMKLEEHEEPVYEGYRQSDLPVFRRVKELASIIRDEEPQPDLALYGKDFSEFGELFKPEQANPAIIRKFLGPNEKDEGCVEIEESTIIAEWRRESEQPKRFNSMPRVANADDPLPTPSSKTSKKTIVGGELPEMPLFRLFSNPEEGRSRDLPNLRGSLRSKLQTKNMKVMPVGNLQSKYVEQKNQALNPHQPSNTSQSFDNRQKRHQKMTKHNIFKNSLRRM